MIVKAAALVTALGVIGGAAWQGYELKLEVGANTGWRLIQTFERLELIRKKRRLSPMKWTVYCKAGL